MKKEFFRYLIVQVLIIGLIAFAMIFADPYFHFHAPISFLKYEISEERYVNDGISRNFSFNGLITGTSMNQNFKTSQAEELFGGNFVKETFSGGAFMEIASNLSRTIERNSNLDIVIWGLDYNGLRRQYDYQAYSKYPEYLYDDNVLNDVNYIFNKDILYKGFVSTLWRTLKGEETTTFDEYSAWTSEHGFAHIIESYDREAYRENSGYSFYGPIDPDRELELTYENITKNLIPVIEQNPDITYYFFYSPYCILYWDSLYLDGAIEVQLEAEEMTSNLLLQYPNVRLYSFYENTDLICDLDLYRNKEHYIAEVNSMILNWISKNEYRITQENLSEHMEKMREIYESFDYEGFYNSCMEDMVSNS